MTNAHTTSFLFYFFIPLFLQISIKPYLYHSQVNSGVVFKKGVFFFIFFLVLLEILFLFFITSFTEHIIGGNREDDLLDNYSHPFLYTIWFIADIRIQSQGYNKPHDDKVTPNQVATFPILPQEQIHDELNHRTRILLESLICQYY